MEGLFNSDALRYTSAAEHVEKPVETDKTAETLAAEEAAKSAETKTPEELAAEEAAKSSTEKTPEELAAEEAAKTTAAKTPEELAAEEAAKAAPAKTAAEFEAEMRAKIMAELGFKDVDELKNKLNSVPETEEQKTARAEAFQKDLTKFAIEKELLSPKDLTEYERVRTTPDNDLVFTDFAAEYAAANKDRVDAEGDAWPVSDDEIHEAFAEAYHTDSKNAVLKAKGEKNLAKEAAALRSAIEEKYEDAKASFEDYTKKKSTVPAFKTFIKSTVTAAVPSELVIKDGDADTKVVFKLTDADGKSLVDIQKLEADFVNDGLFNRFSEKGADKELADYITDKIKRDIWYQNKDKINETLETVSAERALKKSKVGAEAPFQQKKDVTPVVTTDRAYTPQELANFKAMNPFAR